MGRSHRGARAEGRQVSPDIFASLDTGPVAPAVELIRGAGPSALLIMLAVAIAIVGLIWE